MVRKKSPSEVTAAVETPSVATPDAQTLAVDSDTVEKPKRPRVTRKPVSTAAVKKPAARKSAAPIQVLAAASEIYPLIKTGGLADVVGALPQALGEQGVHVKTLVPGYPRVMQA